MIGYESYPLFSFTSLYNTISPFPASPLLSSSLRLSLPQPQSLPPPAANTMNRRRLIDKQPSSNTIPAPENLVRKKLIVKRCQVAVSGLLFAVASAIVVYYIKQVESEPLYLSDLWKPQWSNLNPCWLLCYRAVAFISTALILVKVFDSGGAKAFYFYTQWTFALVMVYFALGTIISAYGCWWYSNETSTEIASLKSSLEEGKHLIEQRSLNAEEVIQEIAGFWGCLMQILYQICGGAVVLTDIVHWCILVPFFAGPNHHGLLELLTHSLNAIFLLLDTALNSMPYPWFRFVYFLYWSCIYIVFQWVRDACHISCWPYDFLELDTPWAPFWYLALAAVHIPCYGIYALVVETKNSFLSRFLLWG